MTTRDADNAIKSGAPVRVCWPKYGPDQADIIIVRRDRWNLYTADGQKFDRGEVQLIQQR